MAETLKIHGGVKLHGEVSPIPNKNAILAALPVCLLTDEDVIYHNVPKSTDVAKMLEMLRLLGAKVDDADYNNLTINCSGVNTYRVDKELGTLIRASIMFAGPLLARFGVAEIPVPGGCVLGKRSISAHIDSFSKAGVSIDFTDDGYARFTRPAALLPTYDVWQFEASVTGTENFLTYAAGTKSHIIITDAASEPHVNELVALLQKMGADINGKGSNRLEVNGSDKLHGAEYTPGPDPIDIGGLIVAAAVTKGKLTLKGGNVREISGGMVEWFKKFNIDITESGADLIVNGDCDLYIDANKTGFPLAGEGLPKFVPRPWPGFPIDSLPAVVTLACKTQGRLLIQNWMYESGLDFVRELNAMGASIFMADPQRIIVSGPVKFKGGNLTSPGVIQACKALFLASLADDVTTTLTGVEILKRRYPNVYETYRALGANIEQV